MTTSGRKYWLYVLQSEADGALYTGISTDPERRLRQHNGEIKGGAKYTRSRRPWRLITAWRFWGRIFAQRMERRFKKLSRKEKLEYVKNPDVWPSVPSVIYGDPDE